MKNKYLLIMAISTLLLSCQAQEKKTLSDKKLNISGVYPHLAFYNNEGECGTGAVVPWAGSLWAITYGPHLPHGSSDKLYQISEDLTMNIRPESIGGTPADRMIHKESNQLFIGSYAIDSKGSVRTISIKDAPGRYTGLARHLTDPQTKLYIGTMEEGFYDIDVNTLKTNTLYVDGNVKKSKKNDTQNNLSNDLLPGVHGKGLYSGQGVMVYSNNGEPGPKALERFDIESGSLSEWNGKDWKVVRRNQFVEVTGPGGIYGNANPATDPIWATGWDHKSLLMGVRDHGKWSFYRMPKASHSYDGAHGWNTEWPRIRDVGTEGQPEYLMTMHGMFWHFPGTFTASNTAGIRPRSAYLKVIGDFTRWNNQLVFGCDDSAQKEFLNKRKVKGQIEGPGQSNSNLWFTSIEQPGLLGPNNAGGYVWMEENITANTPSEAFLFAGWDNRSSWIKNSGNQTIVFKIEVDKQGNNQWTELKKVSLEPNSAVFVPFNNSETGEWVRVSTDKNTIASVSFTYTANDTRKIQADAMFKGLVEIGKNIPTQGLLYGLGDNQRAMGMLANIGDGKIAYYEIDEKMNIVQKEDVEKANFIAKKFAIPHQVVEINGNSVLIVDDLGRRWRLPLGNNAYNTPTVNGSLRICREVATERDLLNCHGTFYELPAENADGYAKIRPISSHNFLINDYASYRGLLIMTGVDPKIGKGNKHIFVSEDNKTAVWAGVIDDLWKLGKPIGMGGPWTNTEVAPNQFSDPYLIGFYDNRSLELSHKSDKMITFSVEVDPTGDGNWTKYTAFQVQPGKTFSYLFPKEFAARWIRFSANQPTTATAFLKYK